jgi:N-acetylglucosamine-6-phosphate deacetylase
MVKLEAYQIGYHQGCVLRANISGLGYCEIEWHEGVLSRVKPLRGEDISEPYCCPGFVDLQINGMAGVDFGAPDLTPEDLVRVLRPLWETGVTTFCPTVITNTHQSLCRSFQVLEEAGRLSADFAASAPCYHLEGPYLSAGESRGAHNPVWMRDPSDEEFEELQEAAGGRIGIVTIAPERPGAIDFIRKWSATGVVFAIGHTDAEPEDIYRAMEAGAALCTHLGNGCPERIHRHRSPIWAQLAADRLSASLICDGFHLTPEFMHIVYGMKRREGTVLITDAIHVTGMGAGIYELGGLPVALEPNGRVVSLQNPGSLAGSTLQMNQAVARFGETLGVPLDVALEAATLVPARLLSRWPVCSSLALGQPANLTIFHPLPDEFEILATYLEGRLVAP